MQQGRKTAEDHSELQTWRAPRSLPVQAQVAAPILCCRSIADFSIQQSVQNGQFLSGLAQNAPYLLVASRANKRIERLFAYVIVTTLAIDQTPTLQPVEPAYDGSAGHAHIGSKLGDREGLAFNIAKRHA